MWAALPETKEKLFLAVWLAQNRFEMQIFWVDLKYEYQNSTYHILDLPAYLIIKGRASTLMDSFAYLSVSTLHYIISQNFKTIQKLLS